MEQECWLPEEEPDIWGSGLAVAEDCVGEYRVDTDVTGMLTEPEPPCVGALVAESLDP